MSRPSHTLDLCGRRLLALAIAGWGVCLALGQVASADEYQYVTRPMLRPQPVTLTMQDARVQAGGHVAVWVGVDNGLAWLQAGIAVGEGDGYTTATPHL